MIQEQIASLNNATSFLEYLVKSKIKYRQKPASFVNNLKELKDLNPKKSMLIYLDPLISLDSWIKEISKPEYSLKFKNQEVWITLRLDNLKNEYKSNELILRLENLDFRVNCHLRLEQISDLVSWPDHLSRISEVIQTYCSHPQVFCSFELNETSNIWADDVFQQINPANRLSVFFYPSKHYFHKPHELGKSKFHTLMFLDGQKKVVDFPLAYKLYHARWAEQMLTLAVDGNDSFLPNEILSRYFPDSKEWVASFKRMVKGKLASLKKGKLRIANSGKPKPAEVSNPADWKKVLITGWYGTETNGDKAILGEVLHFVKSQSPDCKIILTSIYMPISLQTNQELEDLKGVELISIYEKNLDPIVKDCDAVIMGGGPMMETAEMENVQRIFELGNRFGKARIIFGCGVGPFHGPRFENMTRRCIELCTAGFFRDKESWEYANRLVPGNALKFACDPAVGFIHRWRTNNLNKFTKVEPSLLISLLRANTNEFVQGIVTEELRSKNQQAAEVLAALIEPTIKNNGLQMRLLHMNTPWVGGDDRLFNRLVEKGMDSNDFVHNVREYFTLEQHLQVMATADLSVVMRYHGHIFSMALGIPFVSIDYTGKKGKVSSLVRRIQYSDYSIIWEEMNSETNKNLLQQVLNQKEKLSNQLIEETENLVSLLHSTYKEIFN